MDKFTKTDLIKAVSAATGTPANAARIAIDAVLEAIAKNLSHGNDVALAGFGNFKVSQRDARMGRNPSTGEPVSIAAHKVASFKPAKALKDAVNNKT